MEVFSVSGSSAVISSQLHTVHSYLSSYQSKTLELSSEGFNTKALKMTTSAPFPPAVYGFSNTLFVECYHTLRFKIVPDGYRNRYCKNKFIRLIVS